VRLAAFALIGWLAARLGRLTGELENAVEQRTSRLQREVEEHKETAEMLRETMQIFKQIAENIADVFWVTDPCRSKVEYVSPEFEKVWGEPCSALYNSPRVWLDAIHHEDRERITRAVFAKQATGDYDEEYRVVRPDGSLRWVHERAFPVKDERGAVYRLVGIVEDITARKRSERLLQAERDVGVALSSTSDLHFALERLLEVAMHLEGLDCGGVYLVEPATGELQLEVHRGLAEGFLQRVSHYQAETTEARLARAGQSVFIGREQIPRSLEVLWGSHGLRALASVPVRHQGAVLGLLNLGSYRMDEIPPATRVGVEMIASQVAAAIARIKAESERLRLQREILEISDREQAHMGQDIHDGLCQQLIGMGFSANSLEKSLASQARPEAPTARKLCALLDETITESRRVCRGLYPIRLSTEGLAPALQDLASTTHARHNLNCVCQVEGPALDCDLNTATHLYRIAQEAINNAVKHSGAHNIHLQLTHSDGTVTLQIKDDGRGLDQSGRRNQGMGLHIMEYRARILGGSFRIEGSHQGTVVSCLIPRRSIPPT